ncbi:hypothetical protein [Kribbella sp. NPDC006257]|uniref:hypothetical protein n=1 Tax=Kribbella sp. NPDC006257 TaxID=3156738 RepID=UPI0033AD5B0B
MTVDWERLIVRAGDKVQATGKFVVRDDSATMCAEVAVPLAGDLTACSANLLVPVVGIDAEGLVYGGVYQGKQYGWAKVIGTWADGRILVEQQFAPDPGEDWPDPPGPGPAPVGGWQPGALPSLDPLQDYLVSHAERFGQLRVGTVGVATGEISPMDLTQVAVVPVVGDLESARAELAGVFSGNIAVVPANRSILEWAMTLNALKDLMHDKANGISSIGGGADRPIEVSMLLLSEELYRKLEVIGLELVHLRPSIIPVLVD